MISGSTVEEMREDFRRKVAAMREQLDAVDRDREHQMGMVTQLTTHLQRTLQAAQVVRWWGGVHCLATANPFTISVYSTACTMRYPQL